MKNIVIGWIFFFSGSALLGFSLWTLREPATATAAQQPPQPGTPTTAQDAPAGELPMEAPPPEPPPMVATGPAAPVPTTDATPTTPPPVEPEDAMAMEPTSNLTEVLLVFDARSQHISKQVKEELQKLATDHPDANFKIEVAAGELGNPDGNEKLGKRRARAIRKILEDAGVPQRKVSYKINVPGPADGEGEQTGRQWRKATVRFTNGGK